MNGLRIFIAAMLLTGGTLLSGMAAANDDLEVTMEVLDDVGDIDGELMDVRETDDIGDEERGDGRIDIDGEQAEVEEEARRIDVRGDDGFEADDSFREASDEAFERDGRFEESEEVDTDTYDEIEDDLEDEIEDDVAEASDELID